MELRQLEYFMITCEKGSFNQAAECLYTTQPNVSKVISSLEKELGRPLFERSSRGIHITPYGHYDGKLYRLPPDLSLLYFKILQ